MTQLFNPRTRFDFSIRPVALSLRALQDLVLKLSGGDPQLASGLCEHLTNLKIEAIRPLVDVIRAIMRYKLGSRLRIDVGFDAVDGG